VRRFKDSTKLRPPRDGIPDKLPQLVPASWHDAHERLLSNLLDADNGQRQLLTGVLNLRSGGC
jgi:hypothetical protein